MKDGRHWSAETRARMAEMHAQGMGYSDIGRELGIPRTTVRKTLTRGAPKRMKVDTAEIRARAAPLIASGMPQTEIAKALGIGLSTLHDHCGAMGRNRRTNTLMEANGQRIDEMLIAGTPINAVAKEMGCAAATIHKRRRELVGAGKITARRVSMARPDAHLRGQIVELRLQGMKQADIAAALGTTLNIVRGQLDIAFRDNPEAKPQRKRARLYETSEDRARAKRKREREAAERRRMAAMSFREPRPMVSRPERPVAAAPKIVSPHKHRVRPDSAIDRDEEQRQIEAAIAAGIGRRFEVQREITGRQIQTCDDAVRYLEGRGMTVDIRRGSHGHRHRYRVSGGTDFDDRWMLPTPFVVAARAFAAQTTYRIVPLSEVYAGQPDGVSA